MGKSIKGVFADTTVGLTSPGLGFVRPGTSDDASFQYAETLRGVIIEEDGQFVAAGVDGALHDIKVYAGQQIDCLITRIATTGTTCVWLGLL